MRMRAIDYMTRERMPKRGQKAARKSDRTRTEQAKEASAARRRIRKIKAKG
jgi:hypothetical protein